MQQGLARLDVRSCSTPTATASATHTPGPKSADRPRQGYAHHRRLRHLRHDAKPSSTAPFGSPSGSSPVVERCCGSIRGQTRPRRRFQNLPRAGCPASDRAAPISTRTACCGYRSAAAISPASTAASARARSTAPARPATIVRRARPFHQYPGAGFQGIGENECQSQATTPGSTSTTHSGWARMCPSPPAI